MGWWGWGLFEMRWKLAFSKATLSKNKLEEKQLYFIVMDLKPTAVEEFRN